MAREAKYVSQSNKGTFVNGAFYGWNIKLMFLIVKFCDLLVHIHASLK